MLTADKKKRKERKYPERLGFFYTDKNIKTLEKLKPIQKHDVIYVISNEEYLNSWRDKEDQLQL